MRWEYDGTLGDHFGNLTNVWPSLLRTVPNPPTTPQATGASLVGYVVPNNYAAHYGNPPAGVTTVTGGAPSENAAAKPQSTTLDWHEVQGHKGERLEFLVKRFQVLADGWRARIAMTNDSKVAFGLDESRRSFGLMLFTSGAHRDLDARINEQALPTLRPALAYHPDLPSVLAPHESWAGTISARGALVAGSWVRVVFGTLDAIGRTPDAFPVHVVWITDHAFRLRS